MIEGDLAFVIRDVLGLLMPVAIVCLLLLAWRGRRRRRATRALLEPDAESEGSGRAAEPGELHGAAMEPPTPVRRAMRRKDTEELLRILQENDRDQWADDAFDAVRDELSARGVALPQQAPEGLAPPAPDGPTAAENEAEAPVVVALFSAQMDAEMARIRLEGEGIPSALLDQAAYQYAGPLQIASPVRLMVRGSDAQRAARLLKEDAEAGRIRTELMAASAPAGRGTELEPASAPAGRGTELEPASAPAGRGTELEPASAPAGRGTELEPASAPAGRGTELQAGAEGRGIEPEAVPAGPGVEGPVPPDRCPAGTEAAGR